MKNIIESIINKNYDEANSLLENAVQERLLAKIFEMKKITAARLSEQIVQPDGMVLMATGERVLPSIARHRRGLSEAATSIFGEPTDAQRFGAHHDEAERLEASHDALRDKEWDVGVVKGQTPIIEYKKKREKLMNSLYKDAVKRNPNDHVAAAKDVHAKILQNHSNEGIGQYFGHAHKFEDLHPSVRQDLLLGAKRTAEHEEKMKDPVYKARHEASVKRGEEAEKRIAADRAQQDAAMKAFLEKKKNEAAAEKKLKAGESWKSKLNDEIPYEE
jgi:hypothetical protein